MYGANWVHRDISAGNIMAVYNPTTEQYETKLGDFQYAKVFTAETPSVELKIVSNIDLVSFVADIFHVRGHQPSWQSRFSGVDISFLPS